MTVMCFIGQMHRTSWLKPLAPVLLASGLLMSCANDRQPNARREQTNDLLTNSGNLAMTIFRATAVAAIRQPVTTVKLGIVSLWNRPSEMIDANFLARFSSQKAIKESPGTWQFEKLLDRKHFPRAEAGKIQWLVDGPQFFPELDRQIVAAKKTINIQIYIFDNDDIGVKYANILKRRAPFVKVHVLTDDLGSNTAYCAAPHELGPPGFTSPSDMISYLRENSQVKARRILDPWLACDHTKALIFDGSTALIGGMNIGREYYSEWHDLMLKVEGPIVGSITREFNRAWRKAGPWGDFALIRSPAILRRPKPVIGRIPLRVFRTDAVEGRYDILKATLLAIRGSKKRIWLETPYFSHEAIVLAIAAAARRGVDVRVIIPVCGDSPIMDSGNMGTARDLIQAGAKIYQYPKMTHMKAMICDDWACVGSANLDTLSMRINRELDLAFSDRETVIQLEKAVFRPDLIHSHLIGLKEVREGMNGFAETLANQL
jgi:cardiolipin synthase